MASLGQELKRERDLRGITLKEIADSTRISLKYLQAIEEDQLQILPGSFFTRAILRSYARAVGLDEHQVLNRYQELQSYEEESSASELEKRPDSHLALSRRSILTLGGVIVLVIAALLLFFFLRSPEKKPNPPLLTSSELAANSPASAVETPENKPAPEVRQGLDLEMTFLEATWLQVFADGDLVFEGIKKEGDSLRVSGSRELELDLGNAGGLTFFINGKKGKPFGPRGAVRKAIKITLDNYRQFLLTEEENQASRQ